MYCINIFIREEIGYYLKRILNKCWKLVGVVLLVGEAMVYNGLKNVVKNGVLGDFSLIFSFYFVLFGIIYLYLY